MFRLLLLALLFFTRTSFCENEDLTEIYPKCCDSESVLIQINSNNNIYFNCTKDIDSRIKISTKNFFNNLNKTLFCIDILDNKINLFKYSKIDDGDSFVLEKPLNRIDLFPKCCPLNHFYNPKTHGCVKSTDNQTFYAQRKFIKIGLESCKIIVDSRDEEYFLPQFSSTKIPQNQCIDQDESSRFIFRVCKENYDICKDIKCIRKCCPDGQSFVNRAFCKNTFLHGLHLDDLSTNIENSNDAFALIHGYKSQLYILTQDYKFHLDHFGTFFVEEYSKANVSQTNRYQIEDEEYCIEHVSKNSVNSFKFFRPFPTPKSIPLKFLYTRIAMGISCVFLLLTIIYYCLSKEKQAVFGKILISYCFASLIAFILVSYLAYERPLKDWCVILAFLVYYSTLATFTWMNIMSIDIYCTFGSFKAFSSFRNKGKELKRFILYSLYGWGAPLVLTSVTLIFYNVPILPTSFGELIQEDKCSISNENYAKLLFLTSYLTILQMINLILFIKTIFCCLKVKREITKMNDTNTLKGEKKMTFNNFRDRFGLLMKLFLIMGISFIFEVVSTFYDFQKNDTTTIIEIVWDTFNSLQGFFIFVIFILKKRILLKCKKRLVPRLRKVSLMSSIMTQTTSLPPAAKK